MNFGKILEIEESQKKEIKKLREENKFLKTMLNAMVEYVNKAQNIKDNFNLNQTIK